MKKLTITSKDIYGIQKSVTKKALVKEIDNPKITMPACNNFDPTDLVIKLSGRFNDRE